MFNIELAQHRAYGIRTALSDRSSTQDVPYQAVMAAASAAVAAADEADTVSRDGYFVLHLTMPVVVTDAPLFMCWLDERGDLVVEDITEADLVWRHGISGNLTLSSASSTALKWQRGHSQRRRHPRVPSRRGCVL